MNIGPGIYQCFPRGSETEKNCLVRQVYPIIDSRGVLVSECELEEVWQKMNLVLLPILWQVHDGRIQKVYQVFPSSKRFNTSDRNGLYIYPESADCERPLPSLRWNRMFVDLQRNFKVGGLRVALLENRRLTVERGYPVWEQKSDYSALVKNDEGGGKLLSS